MSRLTIRVGRLSKRQGCWQPPRRWPRPHRASMLPRINTIKVALVGCGGRGTGAATNALRVDNGPIKLVAMADVFPNKLNSSLCTTDRRFPMKSWTFPKIVASSASTVYKKAMDLLKPGACRHPATPPRSVGFALHLPSKRTGLNVFMEKPVTVDGPAVARCSNWRRSRSKEHEGWRRFDVPSLRGRPRIADRIQAGEIGDIILMRAYRMAGPTGSAAALKKPEKQSELMYQISTTSTPSCGRAEAVSATS